MARRTCTFEGCDLYRVGRGLCSTHYAQLGRGVPLSPINSVHRAKGSSLLRDAHGRKQCSKCKEWWPEDDFGPSAKGPDGLRYDCRHCRARTYQVERVERLARYRDRRFNLAAGDFARMLSSQGGRCATCGTDTPGHKGWVVDHDHACCAGNYSCGQCVRGILCGGCNLALGLIRDDTATLERMTNYIKRRVDRTITITVNER